jgi:succinate dehydrogenase flavin-adding protein (antitoxin of CptAB toxin-antitoxin module)
MTPAVNVGKLRWQCMRRGLLELDLVFQRFLARRFDELDEDQRVGLAQLLQYEDVDLWSMVSGRSECEDPNLGKLVAMLRSC